MKVNASSSTQIGINPTRYHSRLLRIAVYVTKFIRNVRAFRDERVKRHMNMNRIGMEMEWSRPRFRGGIQSSQRFRRFSEKEQTQLSESLSRR